LLEMEKMKRMEFERMQKKNEQQLRGTIFFPKIYNTCTCVFFSLTYIFFIFLTSLCLSLFFKFYIYLKISTFVFLDAELRLQQLEAEREHLDTELRTAREKVKRAEEAQLLLGTQIVTRPLRGGERIRRTQSFIPTTKERPLSIEKIDSRSTTLQKNI